MLKNFETLISFIIIHYILTIIIMTLLIIHKDLTD